MTGSRQERDSKQKKVRCWPARVVGIIGIILALWLWGYGIQAVPEDPKVIPLVVLIGLMMAGGLIDCVRVHREGIGGLITIVSGIVLYLYLLFDAVAMKHPYSAGQRISTVLTLVLFLSGFLFFFCGRRRKRLKE